MDEDLVDIYEAPSLMEAQLLADRLKEAGVGAFLDNTDSPLDGLTAADQFIIVRVLPKDAPRAKEIAAEFVAEEGTGGDEEE